MISDEEVKLLRKAIEDATAQIKRLADQMEPTTELEDVDPLQRGFEKLDESWRRQQA